MSRSRRHNPIASITCRGYSHGEKAYKRQARKAHRACERSRGEELDRRLFGNPWLGPKDGKQRFDPQRFPQGMRK